MQLIIQTNLRIKTLKQTSSLCIFCIVSDAFQYKVTKYTKVKTIDKNKYVTYKSLNIYDNQILPINTHVILTPSFLLGHNILINMSILHSVSVEKYCKILDSDTTATDY